MKSLPNRRKASLLLASITLLAAASPAFADPVTFFNTGVGADGTPLAPGALDPHYSLIYNPDGAQESSTSTTPNSTWVSPSSTANWISPGSDGNQNFSSGYYVYEATLDLTNYDASTAILSGAIAADDSIYIYLNRGGSAVFSGTGFQSLMQFQIASGFTSGVNLIDFVVQNSYGPTGLLVEDTVATAEPDPAQTPEPACLILVGTGAALLFRRLTHSGASLPA